ncbi:hypothetical protein ACFFRR_006180 [Megaselia abdita]
MVKANKNLKKKQAEEEALKQKLLESMKLSFQDPNDSDEDESDEEVEGMEVGEDSEEQEDGEDEDEEDDDEEDEVKGEESDEDEGVAALDKTVYEESDEVKTHRENIESSESEEPKCKKLKLNTENTGNSNKIISIEEVPLSCYINNLPSETNLEKAKHFLKTPFKRVFSDGKRNSKFYVIFENNEQMEKAIKKLKSDTRENKKTKVNLIPTKWTMLECWKDHCITIQGLNGTISEEDLENYFGKFGKILKIEIHYKVQGLASANILFDDVEIAKKASKYKNIRIGNSLLEIVNSEKLPGEGGKEMKRKDNKTKVTDNENLKENANKIIAVRKVEKSTTKEALLAELIKIGEIERIHEGFKMFIITFENEIDCYRAKNLKNAIIDGTKVKLEGYNEERLKEKSGKVFGVFVERVSRNTTVEQVCKHFENCGRIVKSFIGESKKTGFPGKFAFLGFDSKDGQHKAMTLNRSNINGNSVIVKFKK